MKIIIDTNVIFSALLNTNGIIGEVLFNSKDVLEFYSCAYMRDEIHRHWEKLKKISRLSDANLNASFDLLLTKILFIDEGLIPPDVWLEAELLVKDIDIDDIDFVALTIHLGGGLWTGDKTLYGRLKAKQFSHVYTTTELALLR